MPISCKPEPRIFRLVAVDGGATWEAVLDYAFGTDEDRDFMVRRFISAFWFDTRSKDAHVVLEQWGPPWPGHRADARRVCRNIGETWDSLKFLKALNTIHKD